MTWYSKWKCQVCLHPKRFARASVAKQTRYNFPMYVKKRLKSNYGPKFPIGRPLQKMKFATKTAPSVSTFKSLIEQKIITTYTFAHDRHQSSPSKQACLIQCRTAAIAKDNSYRLVTIFIISVAMELLWTLNMAFLRYPTQNKGKISLLFIFKQGSVIDKISHI